MSLSLSAMATKLHSNNFQGNHSVSIAAKPKHSSKTRMTTAHCFCHIPRSDAVLFPVHDIVS